MGAISFLPFLTSCSNPLGGNSNSSANFLYGGQPTISSVANQTTIGSATAWTRTVFVTLGGISTLNCGSSISVSSSNSSLISPSNVTFSGTYPNCIASFNFNAGASGSTNITLTVTYGSATASTTFTTYLLPPALAVYSVRRVVAGFLGKAFNVRRSSDNATQDIGFTSAGDLDTTSLSSFCGASSCYINTWYDQSGNLNNSTQATLASQPQIVNLGSIKMQNGVPAIYWSGSNFLKATLSSLSATTPFTQNAVAQGGNSVVCLSGTNSAAQNSCLGGPNSAYGSTGTWFGGYGQDGTFYGGTATTALSVVTKTYSSNTVSGYLNGVQVFSASSISYNLTTADILLGIQTDGATYQMLTGYESEVSVYLSSLSTTDRLTLEESQGSYFGISIP
jgi:hypothetical protein